MPLATRTFRIFVSSTFSDLKEERNALHRYVFPRLRELCEQHGTRFQAIDLRWGVPTEAGLDQQTMKICLEEIDRSRRISPRPNFIILLGDRYGWRPLPATILAAEFERIKEVVAPEDARLLDDWYEKDENAIPPEYCLKPREVEIEESASQEAQEGARKKEEDRWRQTEAELQRILRTAVANIPLTKLSAGRRSKYYASATEQEIERGALRVKDAEEHVFCFFRALAQLPRDASASDFVDLDEVGHEGTEAHERLEALKERLRKRLPANCYDLSAEWIGYPAANTSEAHRTSPAEPCPITSHHLGDLPESLDDCLRLIDNQRAPNTLCVQVWCRLARVIQAEIRALAEVEPLAKEIEAHVAFGRELVRFFTGRASVLDQIAQYVKRTDSHPLALHGASGSGKSAVMAQVAAAARRRYGHDNVVVRFIGATPGSSDIRTLLEGLCTQIGELYETNEATPTAYRELVELFPRRLGLATDQQPLVLFLDALDQLSDADYGRNLTWLPTKLPEHVKLVASTIQPGDCWSILERRIPTDNRVELEPMPVTEGEPLLNKWLRRARRELREQQRREVLDKFAVCGLPLYLKLAFEEARRWKSFSPRVELAPDVPGIIKDNLFARLSTPASHGQELVARALGYLAAARNGLSEDELLDVLSLDKVVFHDFRARARHTPPEPRLPVVVWSRLYFDLEPYLTERSADGASLMAFYHRQLREVILADYLAGRRGPKRHWLLARYFGKQPLSRREGAGNLRKLSELPYQETKAEMWDKVCDTLCDLNFVSAKSAAGLTYDLVGDYSTALAALPDAQAEREGVRQLDERVARYTREVIDYAGRWSEARDRYRQDPARFPLPAPDAIPLPEPPPCVRRWTNEEIRADDQRIANNPNRLDRVRAFGRFVSGESHNFERFGTQPGFCIQQAHNSVSGGPVARAAAALLDRGAGRSALLLLRPEHQRPAWTAHPGCLRTLAGHAAEVSGVATGVAMTLDGRRGLSGSWDRTLRVWDLVSGACLHTLAGHTGEVADVAMTPDGCRALSGSWDRTLRVWDLESGACLKALNGHTGKVTAVAMTPDGCRAVSGSDDKTLRVWDLESGACLKTLNGHTGDVKVVAVTPDGRRAVSGSMDTTLRLWDLDSGACIQTLFQYVDYVYAIGMTPDGRRALSGGGDRKLRLWDLESGARLQTLASHISVVVAVAVTPDGRRAVSGSDDKTLRLWDLESGTCLHTVAGHTSSVGRVALTPDGRRALSGSSEDAMLRLWDLESGASRETLAEHTKWVDALGVTPDGRRAVSGSHDQTLRLWDLESGACLKTLPRHTDWVSAVAVVPDGRRAVSGSHDETLRLWDLESGACLWTLGGLEARVGSLAVTPDGRRVLSQSSGLRLWDLESGACLQTLASLVDVMVVAVTPDGRRAVSGNEDGTLRLWNLDSGARLKAVAGHSRPVLAIAVAPDGRRAISGSEDGTLRVWHLASGACLRTIGHTHWVSAVAVTPDGRRAVSGSWDQTLQLWDLESAACLGVLPSDAAVSAAAFARHGLVFGTRAGTVGLVRPTQPLFTGTPLVTATRLWLAPHPRRLLGIPLLGIPLLRSPGRWDDQLSAVCTWCGQRFIASRPVLDTIHAISCTASLSPDDSPCEKLPPEAWADPHLRSECPHCHQPLRFNPFVVDNRDRYWSGR